MNAKNIKKIKNVLTKNVVNTLSETNNFALATTENIALRGIYTVAEWQKYTDKAIKKGLKKSAKNQDIIFSALDKGKVVLVKKITKVADFISKK